jgi:isochorismate synthase
VTQQVSLLNGSTVNEILTAERPVSTAGATTINQQGSPQQRAQALFRAALANHVATAMWRLPGQTAPAALADLTGAHGPAPIDFRSPRQEFVFAPFINQPDNAALRLHADILLGADGIVAAAPERKLTRRVLADFTRFLSDAALPAPAWYLPPAAAAGDSAADERTFTNLVRDAVTFIRATDIAKVVVSRLTERPLPANFDPTAAFAELCVRYPHAFVSLVAIPGVGTWIGASPEVLLTVDGQRLTTMALAGTQRRPEDRPLATVAWGHKEQVEQEMVSAYIRTFFQQSGVARVEEVGPQTVAAGNVVHLQTLFRVDACGDERFVLANRVLQELHPTSAVCGMPKQKALAFILANEGYERSFYSGFLGPVHIAGESHLYVNLRCMRLATDRATLFVGAGITADSDPAAEWRETELKADTMLAVLGA